MGAAHEHGLTADGLTLLHAEGIGGVGDARLATDETERGRIGGLVVLERAHVVGGGLLALLRLSVEGLVYEGLVHLRYALADHVWVLHVHRGRRRRRQGNRWRRGSPSEDV